MDLPPEETLRWVLRAYAEIRTALNRRGGPAAAPLELRPGAAGTPRLVQPDGEFFPDEFHHDMPSLERLLGRMAGYSPIGSGAALGVHLLEAEGEACESGGGCGCGSEEGAGERSGRVDPADEGYRVWIRPRDAGRAEVLTAVMARAIGAIVLHEAAAEIDDRRSEMAAVACGFGVLLVNGAAIWGKACGGLRMTRATALTVEELAVALALFGGLHGIRPSTTRRHLETTQRAAFDVAHDWVESNPMLLEELRDRPQILEGGVFDVEPVRGVIGRWFHKRRLEREMRAVATAPPPIAMTDDKQRRLREARALVDEVMGAVDSEE
jgi:hypothetical protein